MQTCIHTASEINGIIKKYTDPHEWARKHEEKKRWYLYLLFLFKCSQIHFCRHYDCGRTGVIISHFTNRTHQLVHYQSTPWGGWVPDYKMSTGHTPTKLIENPVVSPNISCFVHLHKVQKKSCINIFS